MNEIQNSIFEAMKMFSDNSVHNSNATITIKAKIIEIVDAGQNTYKIEYLDNSFIAYANSNIQYSVGDVVYVLIPDGDFSNDKLIAGSATPSAKNFIQVGDSYNYYDISDNFINLDEIKMSSYDTTQERIEITNINEILNGYFNNYRTFAFSFKAMTNLSIDQQVNGNYGVSLTIPLLTEAEDGSGLKPITKSYTLDVGNMLGNPYRLYSWAPQSIVFSIDEQYQLDTSKNPTITYFCYDFKQDESKIDIKDIFIKDISFKVVEILTEEDYQGYKLTLKASGGEYFLEDAIKKITPTLRVNGKITTYQKRDCYWFIEDASVKPGHSEYVNYGGYGWRCLNKKENIVTADDGSQVFNFATNQYSLEVDSLNVSKETRFKCVIIYDDNIISSTIVLRNLNSNKNIELYPTNGSAIFIKNTGYIDLTVAVYEKDYTEKEENREYIKYVWSRIDKFGRLIENANNSISVVNYNSIVNKDSKSWFETRIKFPANEVEEYNTVYCSAYKIVDGVDKLIGTKSLVVSVSDNFTYKVVINNGDKIYKYDADGDSPRTKDYDGPIDSIINEIEPLSYQVFKANGEQLTPDEYRQCKYTWMIPRNSMIEIDTKLLEGTEQTSDEYYLISGKGNNTQIPYDIARQYSKNKTQNNIILQVDFRGNLLDNIINIQFLKEGDNGTNGTKYAAVMVMGGRESGVGYGTRNAAGYIQKLKFVRRTDANEWYWYNTETNILEDFVNRKFLNVRVYENSQLLDTSEYTVKYSMFDEKVTKPCFVATQLDNGKCRIDPGNFNDTNVNIVQAEIRITRTGNTSSVNADTIIYAYYPIEITLVNFDTEIIPSLDGGFSEVLYETDGTNPSFDSSLFTCNDNILDNNIKQYYKYEWDAANHIHDDSSSKLEDWKRKLVPDNKYDDGNSLNYVKVKLAFNSDLENKLTDEKNQLETENIQLEAEIATTTENINLVEEAKAKYIESNWIEKQEQIKTFLVDRYYVYFRLTEIEKSIDNLYNYLDIQKRKGIDILGNNKKFEKELETLKNQISQAKIKIIEIKSYEDLIYLKDYLITFSPSKDANYLGNYIVNTLQGYIDDINIYIKNYNTQLNIFIQHTDSEREEYISFLNTLIQIKNLLPAAALKDKISTYVENILNSATLVEINENYVKIKEDGFDLYDISFVDTREDNQNTINKNIEDINNINNILNTKGKEIIHIRPIVLLFNRYEMSNINAWDGNKIYTGDNKEFLLAPQVGAGYKEEDNSFTGMVIGLRNTTDNKSQTGLFGYHKGAQSVFLNAQNGSAVFGKAGNGGQIIIDPLVDKALIYSSTYYKNYNKDTGFPTTYADTNVNNSGMLIDLSTPEIKWGNGNFKVDENGHVTAKGGGAIAGWVIGDTTLKSKDNTITLDSENKKIYSGTHDDLTDTNNGFYLSEDGLSIGGKFKVSSDGKLEVGKLSSKHWTIDGTDNNSYISYGTTGFNTTANSVYLGTDGISLGKDKFYVSNDGALVSKFGTIGGWSIGTNTLSAGNLILNSNGSISGGSTYAWSIADNGTANFSNGSFSGTITTGNLTATGGKIGGWNIGVKDLNGNTALQAGNIYISSGGYMYGSGSAGSWSINPDGSAHFTSGSFTGAITATSGTFYGDVTATSLYAQNCTLTGSISAGNVSFKNAAGNSVIYIEGSNNHPTVTGLNVGSGGIVISGAGINCTNSGTSGALWKYSGTTISTEANVSLPNTTITAGAGNFGSLTTFIVGGSSLQTWLSNKANKDTYTGTVVVDTNTGLGTCTIKIG